MGDIESGFDDSAGPVESTRVKVVAVVVGVVTVVAFLVFFITTFSTLGDQVWDAFTSVLGRTR